MDDLDRWLNLLDMEEGEDAWIPRPSWELPERLLQMVRGRRKVRAVMVGAPGSGKSSEIRQWPKMLGTTMQVMYVDLGGTADLPLEESLTRALGGRRQEQLREVLSDWTRERPLLLAIDGFDRVEQPELLFGPHSPWFDPILPSVVVMAPARTAAWGRERWEPRFDWIAHYPPFPVLNPDGSPHRKGARLLAFALARRLPGLPAGALLERVVASAAGLPRDAIRLLRNALLLGKGRLTAKGISRAEQELREELLAGLTPSQAQELRGLKDRFYGDPLLVERGLALRYAGPEGGWWTVHPLVATAL